MIFDALDRMSPDAFYTFVIFALLLWGALSRYVGP